MRIELPEIEPGFLIYHPERCMDDEEYYRFCINNSDLRIEREPNGEIVIMPPPGGETSYRNNELTRQLGNWARKDGRGMAFDSSGEFFLPKGAAYMPDAGWVLKSRLAKLSKDEKRRFPHLCPDFVVELLSPSDRLSRARRKMQTWIDNGAQLGWLIDADHRTVYVYRPGQPPEQLTDITHVDGEGPVEGFRLELEDIWKGL